MAEPFEVVFFVCFPQNTIKPLYPVAQVVIINLKCCISKCGEGGQKMSAVEVQNSIRTDSSSFSQADSSGRSREATVRALVPPFPINNC